MFPTTQTQIIARLEAAAAWGGCSVDTAWEFLVYLSLFAAARANVEFLSDCAKAFFKLG